MGMTIILSHFSLASSNCCQKVTSRFIVKRKKDENDLTIFKIKRFKSFLAPDFTAAAASLAEKELEKLLKEEFEQKRPALSGWLLFLLEDYRCFPTILSERNYYGKKFRLDLVIDGGRGIEKKKLK